MLAYCLLLVFAITVILCCLMVMINEIMYKQDSYQVFKPKTINKTSKSTTITDLEEEAKNIQFCFETYNKHIPIEECRRLAMKEYNRK